MNSSWIPLFSPWKLTVHMNVEDATTSTPVLTGPRPDEIVEE